MFTAGLDIVKEAATKLAASAQSKILTKRSEIIDATALKVVAVDTASDAEVDAILDCGAYDFVVSEWGSISFADFVEAATREEAYGYSVNQLQDINELVSFADSSTLNYRLQRIYELELDDEPEDPDYGWVTWLKESSDESRELIYAEVETYLEEAPNYNDADFLPDTANAQGAAYRFFQSEDWDLLDQLGIVIVDGEHPGSSYFAAELTIPVAEANKRAKVLDVAYRLKAEAGS